MQGHSVWSRNFRMLHGTPNVKNYTVSSGNGGYRALRADSQSMGIIAKLAMIFLHDHVRLLSMIQQSQKT